MSLISDRIRRYCIVEKGMTSEAEISKLCVKYCNNYEDFVASFVHGGATSEASKVDDAVNAVLGTETKDADGNVISTTPGLIDEVDSLSKLVGSKATQDAEATGLFKEIDDVRNLVDNDPKTFNSILELANWVKDHGKEASKLTESISKLEKTVGSKATQDDEATGLFKLISDKEVKVATGELSGAEISLNVEPTEVLLVSCMGAILYAVVDYDIEGKTIKINGYNIPSSGAYYSVIYK